MYDTINSSLDYGGLTLKNRIIFAPTSLGLPRRELLERLGRIAAGGCAMIIIGDVPVLPGGFVPSLYTDKGQAFYRALADVVHREGCRLCAQLHQSDSHFKGMLRYVPGVLTGRISREELPVFVPLLEAAGVTSFHVTLADHGDLRDTIPPKDHPAFGAEGCFLPFCDQVRGLTRLPVCGVGGPTGPGFGEEKLRSGRIDCAAMSRQLIADPDWPRKVSAGRAEEIRRCIRCNKKCLGGMMAHQGVHCIYEERKEIK